MILKHTAINIYRKNKKEQAFSDFDEGDFVSAGFKEIYI